MFLQGLGKHLCGNGDFSRFPWKFQSPWERARFHRPRLAAHGLGGTRGCMHARAVTCAGVHERCDWRARQRIRGGETAHPAGLWHMGGCMRRSKLMSWYLNDSHSPIVHDSPIVSYIHSLNDEGGTVKSIFGPGRARSASTARQCDRQAKISTTTARKHTCTPRVRFWVFV